jgi:hypothetical protein
MDPSISQLFCAEEIIDRLFHRKATGCFKAFTPLESANIFFKQGMIVAASKGDTQGESALREILDWKDAVFIWQPDIPAPTPPLKPVLINFEAFLRKQDSLAKTAGLASTGSKASNPSLTKSMTATGETRSAMDAELLSKHKLTLASLANTNQKFQLTKATSVIGRNPGCDISIPDNSISRQHCILQLTDRGLHVKDLNTVNGTKINGIAMKEGYINIGDKLTAGKIGFVLEMTEE